VQGVWVGTLNRTRCVGRAGVIGGDFDAAADISGTKGDSGIGVVEFEFSKEVYAEGGRARV